MQASRFQKSLPLTLAIMMLVAISGCEGLFGEKEQPVATDAQIMLIDVKTFPNTNEGEPWDDDSDPDLFVRIENGFGVQYTTPDVAENVSVSELPQRFDCERFYLPTLDQDYTIALYEQDEDNNQWWIGQAVFKPYEHRNDRPLWVDVSGERLSARLYLLWHD